MARRGLDVSGDVRGPKVRQCGATFASSVRAQAIGKSNQAPQDEFAAAASGIISLPGDVASSSASEHALITLAASSRPSRRAIRS